jgi:hypothetical protein
MKLKHNTNNAKFFNTVLYLVSYKSFCFFIYLEQKWAKFHFPFFLNLSS